MARIKGVCKYVTRSFSLKKEVAEKIEEIAEKEDRSYSNLVNRILEYYLSDLGDEK